MHPALHILYLLLAALAFLYGLFRYQETRHRRALVGAIVAGLAGVMLALPEPWIIDLVVRAGWGSSAAGAWLASFLHRPSRLAALTYGVLVAAAFASIALLPRRRGASRASHRRRR